MEILVPVIQEVDVLLIGGTLAGCELSLRLRKAGRKVLLACATNGLGTDAIGKLDQAAMENSPLLQPPYRPANCLAQLDRQLLEAGVEIFFETIPLRPLYSAGSRKLAGWFFFGRSGYFAIAAKAVVDATCEGHLPFQMRLARRSSALVDCTVNWNFIGEYQETLPDVQMEVSLSPIELAQGRVPLCCCQKNYRLRENDLAGRKRAESQMKGLAKQNSYPAPLYTFHFLQHAWNGLKSTQELPLFLAATADVPLLLQLTLPAVPHAQSYSPVECRLTLDNEEQLLWKFRYPRTGTYPKVPFFLETLATPAPDVDVLVIGGNPAGVEAARTAAKQNLRVMLIESSGRIQGDLPELLSLGVEIWHHAVPAAVLLQKKKTCGAVVLSGTGESCLVRSSVLIDATGFAIAACAAGAPIRMPQDAELVAQGAVVAPRLSSTPMGSPAELGHAENDTLDCSRALLLCHLNQKQAFMSELPDLPYSRTKIQGEMILLPHDVVLGRQFPDTLVACPGKLPSPYEACHPLFWLHDFQGQTVDIRLPLRALLPFHLEGMLVLGQAISAHKDVLRICASAPDLRFRAGRAAGLLAAAAIQCHLPLRDVDLKPVQQKLVDDGLLPQQVLAYQDEYDADCASPLAEIFRRPDQARRILQAKFEETPDTDTALLLAFLGDTSGRPTISQALAKVDPVTQPYQLCLLVEAFSIIGGNPGVVLDKLRILSHETPLAILRILSLFFQRWPAKSAAPLLSSLLNDLRDVRPSSPGHMALLSANSPATDERRLKALYLAAALHACDPMDEDALDCLEGMRKSWRVLVAIFARNALLS